MFLGGVGVGVGVRVRDCVRVDVVGGGTGQVPDRTSAGGTHR